MENCLLQGRFVTPEMPGVCVKCALYLNTCLPVIEGGGYLSNAECDMVYCEFCQFYEQCGA